MKTFIFVAGVCASALSQAVVAFQAESYVIIDTWAVNQQPQGYSFSALIADSKANRTIQCIAFIGEPNTAILDKVTCSNFGIKPTGKLSHYRVVKSPIEALRDQPYRSGKSAYWMIDPDTGKGEFCTMFTSNGPSCLDIVLPVSNPLHPDQNSDF